MRLSLCFLLPLIFLNIYPANVNSQAPHIIYILVDDMGWNDVSFHGSDQIPTPNIDALAYQGVILNRHYVQPVCTPSRTALMTGKYPFHTGIHDPLVPSNRVGLSLSEKIMPQYFKEVGYATHIVGKWHLGFYQEQFTPMARGFDTHFGYWSGAISYYDHIDVDPYPPKGYSFSGHDMRRKYSTAWDTVGQYATDLFTEEAVRVIENNPQDKPLFLYLAHLATHAGNEGKWLEAPQEEINRFSHISNPNRRTYAAMVSKLDQSVGAVVEALERKNMLQNSIVVFLSDNGAPNIGLYKNWGSNYPWRGHKATFWEGGLRTPALVWSPLIQKPSRVHNGLMHITDWLPTLLSAAGYDDTKIPIDGVSQWESIARAQSSPRDEVIVDLNDETKMYSVIIDHFKYIKGAVHPQDSSEASTFLNLDTIDSPNSPTNYVQLVGSSPTWRVLEKYCRNPLLLYCTKRLRQAATITCDIDANPTLDCNSKPCLFNLETDPCEQKNIADSLPAFVDHIHELIHLYKMDAVPNVNLYADPASNPDKFNGTWSIWEEY